MLSVADARDQLRRSDPGLSGAGAVPEHSAPGNEELDAKASSGRCQTDCESVRKLAEGA